MDASNQVAKRKAKEDRRRDVKSQRKSRLQETKNQGVLKKAGGLDKLDPSNEKDAQKLKEKAILKQREGQNKETLTEEVQSKLSFAQKLQMVKSLTVSIVSFPAFAQNKLKDLLKFCADNNLDVVLKAVKALQEVFCDILPDYRIRQLNEAG